LAGIADFAFEHIGSILNGPVAKVEHIGINRLWSSVQKPRCDHQLILFS